MRHRTKRREQRHLEEAVSYEKSCGLVINPFGESVIIPKEGIRMVLDMVK